MSIFKSQGAVSWNPEGFDDLPPRLRNSIYDLERVLNALADRLQFDRTGDDRNIVTGTAGTSGNVAEWDANGDVIDGARATDGLVDGSGADNQVAHWSDADTITGDAGLTWTGSAFAADGAATFNESGADVDFRVESSASINSFFVDGANGRIGLGTGTPSDPIELVATQAVIRFVNSGDAADYWRVGLNSSEQFVINWKGDATAEFLIEQDGSLRLSSGQYIKNGSGSPEGAVTAPVGSLFLRTDGGAGTSMYVKESGSGNTGWVGK